MSECRVAIAGLGTVGAGVVRLLRANANLIKARAGRAITVRAVSARSKNKKRDCNLSGIEWVDGAQKLAAHPDIDIVVELIGGANGAAAKLAVSSLTRGKHFVTANKALLASKGAALARLADKNKVQLSFEAAVAGGIPIVKTLREAMAGNSILSVRGILNGTCNYILTRMGGGLSFAEALKEAQAKGYAEADPSADIDGHDAANKLAILSALAFGGEPDLKSVSVEGIGHLATEDLQFAEELGCRVRLLGAASRVKGRLEQRVGPALVPKTLPLAQVKGALNAVMVRGDFVGDLMLEGAGAGAEPTASAVVADIIDIARGIRTPAFGIPASQLEKAKTGPALRPRCWYLRLQVMDKPGVVADISSILRDEAISIESLIQRHRSPNNSVPVVMVTHAAAPDAMRRAAAKIAGLRTVVEKPCLMPIEEWEQ